MSDEVRRVAYLYFIKCCAEVVLFYSIDHHTTKDTHHHTPPHSEAAKRMAARSAMGFAAGALRQTAAVQARVVPQMVPRTVGQQTRMMGECP